MFKPYTDVLVLVGAGFGIDSGLPDYNGVHQMAEEAAAAHGIEPHQLEEPSFYHENPDAVWGFKARVINQFLTKKPHSGYFGLLKALEKKNHFIVTSNIDEHFHQVGMDESRLWEIHGRLGILQCVNRACNQKHNLWALEEFPQETDMKLTTPAPRCIYCKDYARPNVCFTADNFFCNKLRDAQKARYMGWMSAVAKKKKVKLLVLEIGCGRHKDSIGVETKSDGTLRTLSKEISLPSCFNQETVQVMKVTMDKDLVAGPGELVFQQTGKQFFDGRNVF